jgi:peptidyl-prolyl cis-trans isomerase C
MMKIVHWASHIAVSAVLCLAISHTAFSQNEKKTNHKGDQVAARVNGVEIKTSEVRALENALPPQIKAQAKDKDKLFGLLRDQLIDIKLVTEEAKKANLENDPDVQAALAKAKEQILIQAYLAKQVKSKVTEQAVRAAYDEEVKNMPKDAMEVKARHILVKDEKTAQDIIKKLEGGADFMKLARDHSIDKASASNGGDIGYFQKDEMVSEFANAAFGLKPGEYTKTPVKTQFGYHIIKTDDRRKVKPKKFEEEVERLQSMLAEKAMTELVKDLRSKAHIERFDQNGKPDKAVLGDDSEPSAKDSKEGEKSSATAAPASSHSTEGSSRPTTKK